MKNNINNKGGVFELIGVIVVVVILVTLFFRLF